MINGFPFSELPIVYWEKSEQCCAEKSEENLIADKLDGIFLKLSWNQKMRELNIKKERRGTGITVSDKIFIKLLRAKRKVNESFDQLSKQAKWSVMNIQAILIGTFR